MGWLAPATKAPATSTLLATPCFAHDDKEKAAAQNTFFLFIL